MSIEAGVVIDNEGQALFWHEPQNRTGGSLPDSSTPWDVLWNNRDNISGFAHSHPGYGMPSPSYTDITTFAAVEAALGKRLLWPIISGDAIAVFEWCGPGKHDYQLIYSSRGVLNSMFVQDANKAASLSLIQPNYEEPPWVDELRKRSNFNQKPIEVQNGGQYHPGQ